MQQDLITRSTGTPSIVVDAFGASITVGKRTSRSETASLRSGGGSADPGAPQGLWSAPG